MKLAAFAKTDEFISETKLFKCFSLNWYLAKVEILKKKHILLALALFVVLATISLVAANETGIITIHLQRPLNPAAYRYFKQHNNGANKLHKQPSSRKHNLNQLNIDP
jgi:hypothetical protein